MPARPNLAACGSSCRLTGGKRIQVNLRGRHRLCAHRYGQEPRDFVSPSLAASRVLRVSSCESALRAGNCGAAKGVPDSYPIIPANTAIHARICNGLLRLAKSPEAGKLTQVQMDLAVAATAAGENPPLDTLGVTGSSPVAPISLNPDPSVSYTPCDVRKCGIETRRNAVFDRNTGFSHGSHSDRHSPFLSRQTA
jgi:hypothetical protein